MAEIDPVDIGHMAHDLNRIADALERLVEVLEGGRGSGGANKGLAALKTVAAPAGEIAPPCEVCGGPTKRRISQKTNKPFYGCAAYPDCKGFGKRW